MIDFKQIADNLLSSSEGLLRQWLPDGVLRGNEWVAKNPKRNDTKAGSFSINIRTGIWTDFALGDVGGADLISLYSYLNDLSQTEAAAILSGQEIPTYPTKNSNDKSEKNEFTPILTKKTISANQKISCYYSGRKTIGTARPTLAHRYTIGGLTYGYVLRVDRKSGKTYLPIFWSEVDGKEMWVSAKFPTPSLLYNYDAIERAEAVIIVEGEKTADALQAVFPEIAVVTWAGGANAHKTVDFSPLHNKKIIIWPDADPVGKEAAEQIAMILVKSFSGTPCSILKIQNKPLGWDAADAIEEGWSKDQIKRFMDGNNERRFASSKSDGEDSKLVVGDANPWAWVNSVEWVAGPNAKSVFIGTTAVLLDRGSLNNAVILLSEYRIENGKRVGDAIVYNLFENDLFINLCPPWESPIKFKPHKMREEDYTMIRMWLERNHLKLGKNDVMDVALAVGKQNTVNPPKDYFETVKWDKVPRLDKWLTYYLGAETEPAEYLSAVGRKWLVGAVSRIYEPGAVFQTALFLEGNQGAGKSRSLQALATLGNNEYFSDAHIDFKSKDSLMVLQGKIIVEMAELVGFRKGDTEEVKAWIGRPVDEYRPPYARLVTPRPRMFVLAGTHNPKQMGVFTDTTGNRRYWPVTCGKFCDVAAIIRDREQLWAEAVALYKAGEKVFLTTEEELLAKNEQSNRVIEDVAAWDVERAVSAWQDRKHQTDGFSTSEIMTECGISLDKKNMGMLTRINDSLQSMGYTQTQIHDRNGYKKRIWTLK